MTHPADSYEVTLRKNAQEIRGLLQASVPFQVALELEKRGWPREWACAAVETIECQYNPAGVAHGPIVNQKLRDASQMRFYLGIGLFVIGALVTVVTLATALESGGLVIVAYGAILSGASMAAVSFGGLKRYPDRPIPKYLAPRNPNEHDPGNY